MTELTVSFDTSESGTFKILELPPDLIKLLEDDATRPERLCIKGAPDDDAVLCTDEKTYAVRSVVLSNTVLVVSSRTERDAEVVVRDELHDLLELTPCLPRLRRLDELLSGLEYGEDNFDDDDMEFENFDDGVEHLTQTRRRRVVTYEDARRQLQASDAEFLHGLASRHILNLRGCLYSISSGYLTKILDLILTALTALSLPHSAAPVEDLSLIIEQDHEVKREVVIQVMSWFGTISDDLWTMNVGAVLTQVGLGVLCTYQGDVPENVFMQKWAETVGDIFVSEIKLGLLSGNFVWTPVLSSFDEKKILYYPRTTLPLDPAARFGKLFATQTRWRTEEIEPFLDDIAVDKKERDHLLLKYARAITDNGVWFITRVKYTE